MFTMFAIKPSEKHRLCGAGCASATYNIFRPENNDVAKKFIFSFTTKIIPFTVPGNILSELKRKNEKLNTERWKVIRYFRDFDTIRWLLVVDRASASAIADAGYVANTSYQQGVFEVVNDPYENRKWRKAERKQNERRQEIPVLTTSERIVPAWLENAINPCFDDHNAERNNTNISMGLYQAIIDTFNAEFERNIIARFTD